MKKHTDENAPTPKHSVANPHTYLYSQALRVIDWTYSLFVTCTRTWYVSACRRCGLVRHARQRGDASRELLRLEGQRRTNDSESADSRV